MRNVSPENNKIFWMAPILVLAIGTFPLPIGYYTLSRLVVCASALYFAYNFYKKNNQTKQDSHASSGNLRSQMIRKPSGTTIETS